jgi:hypothetical protein
MLWLFNNKPSDHLDNTTNRVVKIYNFKLGKIYNQSLNISKIACTPSKRRGVGSRCAAGAS